MKPKRFLTVDRLQFLVVGLALGFIIGHAVGGGLATGSRRSLLEKIDELHELHKDRDEKLDNMRENVAEQLVKNSELKTKQLASEKVLEEFVHHQGLKDEVHDAASDSHDIEAIDELHTNEEPPLPENYEINGLELPKHRAQNKTIIVIPCNMGYVKFAFNIVCSLRKLGIHNYVLLAMDKDVLEVFKQRKLPVYVDKDLPFVTSKSAAWAEENFHKLVCTKLVPVTNLLQAGYNVLLTDADITWKQNPMSHVRWDLSLTFSIGSCHKSLPDNADLARNKLAKLNTGFYFAQAKPEVIALLKKAYQICKKGSLTGDQPAINTAIHQDSMASKKLPYTYGFFNGCLFANGCIYFKHLCGEDGPGLDYKPVIVHANYIVGRKKKINSLKKHGLWTTRCIEGDEADDGSQKIM